MLQERGAERLPAFQSRYAEIAEPFEWKFTREDLVALMQRLSSATAA